MRYGQNKDSIAQLSAFIVKILLGKKNPERMTPVDNNSSVSHGHACMFRYSESSVCETSVLHFIHNTLVKKYLKNLKNMGGGGKAQVECRNSCNEN